MLPPFKSKDEAIGCPIFFTGILGWVGYLTYEQYLEPEPLDYTYSFACLGLGILAGASIYNSVLYFTGAPAYDSSVEE